ncbi:FHA domain-containing protein PS1 [Tanacetum coccineum]
MDETETLTVPSFTVLKNGSILKNIILLNKSSSSSSQEEQILLVGRHPHCNITLGHPSISRYHLLHGTWVCGMRVKPGVFVRLKEGDTVKIGGSSRLYELHWVPVNTLSESCDVYVVKQGESENQDEKDDTCSLDDDMESLEWPLEDKVQDSPFKKLDPLICSVSEYLSSSGDDTEVEHSSSSNESNEGNKNGQVFSTILDQPESVVVQTVPAVHDFNSMSELEPQIDGVNKEDISELVVNCSKSSCDATEVEPSSPWGTGNEIGDMRAVRYLLEDQLNWLRDNVNDEFELQSDGIIKQDPVSVLNCFKSLCDDAEVEHSSPKKTGNINGELFTAVSIQSPFVVSEAISEAEVSDSLDKSKDESYWLRGNLSNEFEQLGYGTMKEDLISVAAFDALNQDIARSDEINMGNEIEQVSEQEIDNWLRDNISNEYEQLSNGTVKDKMVSVALSEDIKTCEKDASDKEIAGDDEIDMGNENEPLIQQEIDIGCVKGDDDESFTPSREGGKEVNVGCVFEQMNQIKTTDESASVILFDGLDNEADISSEFGLLSHSAMKGDPLSVASFDVVKTHEKDVFNQDVARCDEIEMGNQSDVVIQQEIDNGSISVALNDDVKGDEEEPFMADMAGAEEVNLGCQFEQMNKMNIMDESASVILFDGLDNEVDMGIKFELIDDEIMKNQSVFEAIPDGTDLDQEQTLTPVSRVKEVCMNLEAMMNGSVPTNLFDSLDENEFEFFTPDKENKNPEDRSGKSLQKRWKKAVSPIINEEKDIFGFSKSLLTNVDESKNVFTMDERKFASNSLLQRSPNTTDKVDPFAHCEEVLFSSEKETKSGQVEMEASCNSINYPETVQKVTDSCQNVLGGAKKSWTMVVDTSTLLHDESLKHLKLLKGIKGTQLFIPKTVIRELMDLKSQYAFYKRSTVKASLALQWIDESMLTTSWWIHMDDEILHHPQAETEVLQSALRLCKEISDGKIIILSNDLTLKIKAMAEGVMCEEAEEFRRSLVNPFSERFMWVGSSARGLTWSCVDDVVRNYHGCSLHGSHRLKGLRLLARG